MKTRANDPINAHIDTGGQGQIYTCESGLTKREYFAATILSALLSRPNAIVTSEVVELAVNTTNILIAQLNMEETC